MGMPVSVLKAENIFEKVIAVKYDIPMISWKCLMIIQSW